MPAETGEPILRAEELGREVDGKTLVDAMSFAVAAGEVVAVTGPSGSGKSSLLRLLNRLDEPTAGTVYLEGEDYRSLSPRELRRRVGMLMQSPYLFPGTIADNLRFGPAQRGESLDDEAVAAMVERVGLGEAGGREVGKLSGGEAQRVALARALANRPSVLLLDEPTSALDDAAVRGVEELLREIVAERGLAALVVTHDLAQARRLADRALVLARGRLERSGPVEEVLDAD